MTDSDVPEERPAFCFRCGHIWLPQTSKRPKRCPRCRTARWDVPEKKDRPCKFCGEEFCMQDFSTPCPVCGRLQTEGLTDRSSRCNQCDYEWTRKYDEYPEKCPLCRSANWDKPKVERLMCYQCGHVWIKRKTMPRRCPDCRSTLWNEPPKTVQCQRCGHVWNMRKRKILDSKILCPRCKSAKWNIPANIINRSDGKTTVYECVENYFSKKQLFICSDCNNRWYMTDDESAICKNCGKIVTSCDKTASTSMVLWSNLEFELRYVTENHYGCVYLLENGIPVSVKYIFEVLRRLDMDIEDVVDAVNNGEREHLWQTLASEMYDSKNDYIEHMNYLMKRLSINENDAMILALHYKGMSPEAISQKMSQPIEEILEVFEKIMSAFEDSGIVVDDTVYTPDPFRYY